MKKLFVLLSVMVVLSMALAACGAPSAEQQGEEPEVLTVWIQWGDNPSTDPGLSSTNTLQKQESKSK